MAFQLKISGDTSNNQAEVDANHNLKTTGPLTNDQAGFAAMLAENDAGSVTGSRYVREPEVSADFRLRTAQDNMLFADVFAGSAFNTTMWTQVLSTMTATVASNFAQLNAGASTASGAVARVQTWRSFPIFKTFTTYAEMEVQFTQTPQTNNVCEWGMFYSSGTTAPTDGAFFRLTSAGTFICVLNYGGTETVSSTLNFSTLIGVNLVHQFLIYFGSDEIRFWIDNILVATISTPDGQGSSLASMNVPLAFRNYNSGVTSSAQIMKVGNVAVAFGDQAMSKPWPHVLAGSGQIAAQGQTGGTLGTTALYTNSLAAGAGAAMTNTTAALGSGLGGQFAALPTLAAGTDGIVSSYQVPVGTASLPGKSLYLTGIRIQSAVTTVLAGGPVLYAYSLAFGHTAVSLATTESATTKAPRRIPLGYETLAATAAVGTIGAGVFMQFATPVVVQPGEFIQVVAKNLGVVTTTGVVTFNITVDGYME